MRNAVSLVIRVVMGFLTAFVFVSHISYANDEIENQNIFGYEIIEIRSDLYQVTLANTPFAVISLFHAFSRACPEGWEREGDSEVIPINGYPYARVQLRCVIWPELTQLDLERGDDRWHLLRFNGERDDRMQIVTRHAMFGFCPVIFRELGLSRDEWNIEANGFDNTLIFECIDLNEEN